MFDLSPAHAFNLFELFIMSLGQELTLRLLSVTQGLGSQGKDQTAPSVQFNLKSSQSDKNKIPSAQ